MTEYVVIYRGKRIEFPTWKEMQEFLEEHKNECQQVTK